MEINAKFKPGDRVRVGIKGDLVHEVDNITVCIGKGGRQILKYAVRLLNSPHKVFHFISEDALTKVEV